MSDTPKERAELIAELISNGMAPDLAPRAFDSFTFLLQESETLLALCEREPQTGVWLRYGFMQGFVAGAAASAHHN